MDVSDARQRLVGTRRDELQDAAFGDAEVYWYRGEELVAEGHFGGGYASFHFSDNSASFGGDQARALRHEGTDGAIERNDEQTDLDYVEGRIMPGLTKEAVLEELTRPPEKES